MTSISDFPGWSVLRIVAAAGGDAAAPAAPCGRPPRPRCGGVAESSSLPLSSSSAAPCGRQPRSHPLAGVPPRRRRRAIATSSSLLSSSAAPHGRPPPRWRGGRGGAGTCWWGTRGSWTRSAASPWPTSERARASARVGHAMACEGCVTSRARVRVCARACARRPVHRLRGRVRVDGRV